MTCEHKNVNVKGKDLICERCEKIFKPEEWWSLVSPTRDVSLKRPKKHRGRDH